jgi:hypothetical protein
MLLQSIDATSATMPIGAVPGQIVYVVDQSLWAHWSAEQQRFVPLTPDEAFRLAVINHENFGRWVVAHCKELDIEVSEVKSILEAHARERQRDRTGSESPWLRQCRRPGPHSRHSWCVTDDDGNPLTDTYICEGPS